MSVQIVDLPADQSKWYGFQRVISTAMGNIDDDYFEIDPSNATLAVFGDGCKPPGTFAPSNCTVACLEPANIWNGSDGYGPYTLQNCLVYPMISYLLQRNLLTENSTEFVQSMGYQAYPDSRLAGSQWPAISPCISSFCGSNSRTSGCDAGPFTTDYGANAGNFSLLDTNNNLIGNFSLDFPTAICTGLNANVNPDLGGPGVFLSYLLQIGLALAAWLNLRFQDNWTRYLVWLTTAPFNGSKDAWRNATRIQSRLHTHNYRKALVDSLKEFQAAQIFFMISTEIAVLVVLRNAREYEANSWQTVWNDIGVLYDLALAGCVPVVFMMLVLYAAGDRSAYFTYITAICVFLSGATWISVSRYNNIDAFAATSQNIESFPDTCGGPFAPIEYCFSSMWWFKNSSGSVVGGVIVMFCWFVAIVLLLEYVRVFPGPSSMEARQNCYQWLRSRILTRPFWDKYERTISRRRSLRWISKVRLHERSSVIAGIVGLLLLAMELMLMALICILLDDYLRIFTDGKTDGSFAFDWSNWSLGQVISVTLWASVIVKYLWNTIVGLEEGDRETSNGKSGPELSAHTQYALVSNDNLGTLENQDKSPIAIAVPIDDSDGESHPMTTIQHAVLRN